MLYNNDYTIMLLTSRITHGCIVFFWFQVAHYIQQPCARCPLLFLSRVNWVTTQWTDHSQPVRRLSKALDGCLVLMSTTGDRWDGLQAAAATSTRLKTMFFNVVDNEISKLNGRFDSMNTSLSLAVTCLLPGADNCFNEDRRDHHRLLQIRTDGSHSQVHWHFSIFTIISSTVVRL